MEKLSPEIKSCEISDKLRKNFTFFFLSNIDF